MKKYIYLAITIIFFNACEKTVAIEIPYEGDKIVANTFIRQDSLIYCKINQSVRLNSGYNSSISNQDPPGTVVQLLENNIAIEQLVKKQINFNTYFVSTIKAKPNATYKIKVTATNFNAVEGEDKLPNKPNCNAVSFTGNANNNLFKAVIKINDPITEKNYYAIRLRSVDTSLLAFGPRLIINKNSTIYFKAKEQTNNEALDLLGENDYEELIISDDKFNGKNISVSLEFDYFNINGKYISPEIVSLSQSAYRYLISLENQRSNSGNPFGEPALVFSNIKNGYGIVAGTADSVLLIRKQ